MTWYHVLYYQNRYPEISDEINFWKIVKNPSRTDDRWEADSPDQACSFAAAGGVFDTNQLSNQRPGVYIAVPQHRFTKVRVSRDGTTERIPVIYAE